MHHEYRILMLEDLATDAELITRELRRAGLRFVLRRVETREDFGRELREFAPDIVLSDYSLPRFDGLSALRLTLDVAPKTPFVMVTASINEETAVLCMKAGATDYILKDNLARLSSAVISALDKKFVMEEKARAEARLRLMEAAVVNADDIVMITEAEPPEDPGSRIVYVNQAFTRVTGYTAEEIIGKTPCLLHGPKTDPAELARIQAALIVGRPVRSELVIYCKDGAEIWVEMNLVPVTDAAGRVTHFVSVQRNVTARKEAEAALRLSQAQLAQAQKMEAVGRLAGGVAHDFNNLLTVIMGFSMLLLNRLGPEHPLRGEVEQIKQAGERAASLTSQLLAFSRKQVVQARVINLGEVVVNLEKIMRRLIGEDIELATSIQPDAGRLNADPSQIEQLILNLAVNARDAMPQGGKLTIEVRDADLDETYVRTHPPTVPGKYAVLTVSDTGCGMDEQTKARIFEPFFTTKEPGKGTGLGLAMVYGIVKQSGGFIWVYSEPEVGTTFKVYLPRYEGEASPARAEALPPRELPRGDETILLVEDEAAVRRLARELLETQGYTVLEAASGDEALELGATHDSVSLLLTDVVMPRISGRELATRLTELRPHLKVLYMSGYTDDTIVRHGLLEHSLAFIQKPFSQESLVCKVREVLDQG